MADGSRAGSAARIRYRFPPLERRGVIAGWRGGQIASVAASLVVAVLALRARPSVGGLLLAVLAAGAGLAVAFWPVRGRTVEQWLPLVAGWRLGGRGRRLQLAPGPRLGHRVTAGGDLRRLRAAPPGGQGREEARLGQGVFDGLRLAAMDLSGEGPGTRAGVVLDARARTATAVLALRGHSFALMSTADQEARVAAWASVLASLAREGSDVHRVQWVERSLPDAGDAVRRYFEDRCARPSSAAAQSYGSLLREAAPVTRRHRVLLAVSVNASRSARAIRRSGGGEAGYGEVLGREARALQRALEGADIWVDGLLGPAALAAAVREAVLPAASAGSAGDGPEFNGHRPAAHPSGGGAALPADRWDGAAGEGPARDAAAGHGAAHEDRPGAPWPLAVGPEWDAVRIDGTWHVSYWIAEWPRIDVTPDFLGPLLFSADRRSISLVMEPVSPTRAARQVARARTADAADVELRRRGGFLVGARQHRERHSVEQRDAELADGHAQFRFAGYVSLTADSRVELDAASVGLEQLAGQSHLELRRLYGEQDVAFACTLPIGRGLP